MFSRDHDGIERKEKAEEHLRQQIAFAKETGPKDASFLNSIVAKNILHEDLGRFDAIQHRYQLDNDTRDRLITHSRQDAAHALLNTATLLEQVKALRSSIRIITVLMFALVFAVLAPLLSILIAKN